MDVADDRAMRKGSSATIADGVFTQCEKVERPMQATFRKNPHLDPAKISELEGQARAAWRQRVIAEIDEVRAKHENH
jgi:hypothetical protein